VGARANANAAAMSAERAAGRVRNSGTRTARKVSGATRSRPSARPAGNRPPPYAPIAVPTFQATYMLTPAPSSLAHAGRPLATTTA